VTQLTSDARGTNDLPPKIERRTVVELGVCEKPVPSVIA
jgi:hypothetical protein